MIDWHLNLLGLSDTDALNESIKTGKIFDLMENVIKEHDHDVAEEIKTVVLDYLANCDDKLLLESYRKLLKKQSGFNKCLKDVMRNHYRINPSQRKNRSTKPGW